MKTPPASSPTTNKKPIRGLRTFASDQAKLHDSPTTSTDVPKASTTTDTPKAAQPAGAPVAPRKIAPIPQAAPVKAHKDVEPEKETPSPSTTPTKPKVEVPKVAAVAAHKDVPKQPAKPVTTLNEHGEELPAFHKLSTDHDEIDDTDVTIEDDEADFGTTFVSDKKRKHQGVFAALATEITSWWKRISNKKKRSSNSYAIPDSSLRKGVIQKATSKTGTSFTSSGDDIRARVRARHTSQKPPVAEETEMSWSPNTESGYALLESPHENSPVAPTNVTVAFENRSNPANTVPATQALAPAVEKVDHEDSEPSGSDTLTVEDEGPTEEFQPEIDDLRWRQNPPAAPVTPPVETPPYIPPVERPEAEEVPARDVAPTPQPVAPAPSPVVPKAKVQTSHTSTRKPTSLLQLETNRLTLYIGAVVAAVALVVVVGNIALSALTSQSVETPGPSVATSLLSSAPDRDMELTSLTTESIREIIAVSQSTSGSTLQEIRLLLNPDRALSPQRFMSILEANVDPSFTQTITDIRLAVSNTPTRAILFSIADNETALGGMLSFEPTLYSTSNELFGGSPSAAASRYVDERIDTVDVRVLYNNDGETLLVYGFITPTLIVIAPNHDQFDIVLNHK